MMDKHSEKIDLGQPAISLNTSTIETAKNESAKQSVRSKNEPPAKSISCSELRMKYLKSSSCIEINEGKTLFFNEKGWPVKVMKLTEDSPPKTTKPRPTRSVPTASSKKSPHKEKSLYTQKKPAPTHSKSRTKTESVKENKENEKTESFKDIAAECNSKKVVEQTDPEKTVEEKTEKVGLTSDLKSMLQKLDETMGELTSVNEPSQIKVTTNNSTKSIGRSQRNSSLERKKTQNDIIKDDILNSARSNKYNSKEVKAYMQAKRVERKIQMSEETRRKQNMLEMQKKNLEKLREKALQVLKKSSAKTVDENKPKWQGPLEDDDSEVLPPAIHIFESKVPTARKSKSSVKVEEVAQGNIEKESLSEKLPFEEPEKDYNKSEEIEKALNKLNENGNMDCKKTNLGLENTRKKLRPSKSKPPIENPPVQIGMEAAAMEIVPQLQLELENARRNFESHTLSPRLSRDRNLHNSTIEPKLNETLEITIVPQNSRRTTFTCSPRGSDFPMSEEPLLLESPTKITDNVDISPTNSHRKRHHLASTKTNNSSLKKLCAKSSDEVLNNKVSNSIEDQLRKIQEVLHKQKENKEPDKLLAHMKPDGFSIMNVMKMKLLADENKYVFKTNSKEKIITTKNSFDDDTDAPSIISMEEDFRHPVEPLRLSDLQLQLGSDQTSVVSQLSSGTSKTSLRRNANESLKSSSASSYTFDAPPLVVPESVQNLKLSSTRSYSDLSYLSHKIVSSHSSALDTKMPSHASSQNSFVEKPLLSYSASSVSKISHGHSNKRTYHEESIRPEPYPESLRDLQAVQRLIDDAQFQRKQVELMYKTQEDILLAQYKAELYEIDMRYRSNGQLTDIGMETKRIVEEKYKTPLTKLRQTRDQALSNSDARIEYLGKQISWLKKQKRSKNKPRSAEASPKKLTPLRSISLVSVVENSSSSESSVGHHTFDDKKRQEVERDKSSVSSRRKIDKEMLSKLQEELARVQELQKDRSVKSNRSRRDKSTSPLESVHETSTKDVACSVNGDEENVSPQATSSLQTVEEARSTDVYNSESFESPESSETPRQPKMISKVPLSSKPFVTARPNYKSKVLIKVPLSPRVQVRSKRRGSSGSDESLLLSQNETQSEQSDYEVRISALKEQKRQRFAELNRLERELKRAQREHLKATEAALVKQIQAYELKIVQTKKQLEEVTATNIVRPQIKHPRVSDKFFPRTSDVFQKTQIIEEPSKPQEQNVSDLDTNSLKSISEASSTETTIQSSGIVAATEASSKPSVEVDDDTKEVSSVESEVTEALSSVATETDGPTVLDTQKSVETEIPDLSESVGKSIVSESANINNAIDWMDAEEFFNQLETSDKIPSDESKLAKTSSEKSVSSASPETNISEELSNEPLDKSKSNSSSQEFHDAEDIGTNSKTESFMNSSIKPTDDDKSNVVEEESLNQIECLVKDNATKQLEEGRVTSVISQPVSNKSQKSVPESLNLDLQSVTHTTLHSSKSESDDSQSQYDDDDDVNISNVVSEKSDISEMLSQSLHSVLTDSNVTSQCYSADEVNTSNVQSDESNDKSAQSEMIKVFVSNKTQEPKEQSNSENNNVNLNETFVVSESATKPGTDDSVIDNITDKILQNLLNDCLVCKTDDNSVEVANNIPESEESSETAPVVEPKCRLLVNDFTQKVLNKFVKDATDCMIKIKDTKKAALIKSIYDGHNKENELPNSEVSSNKLLEALALERKISPSDKGREETTSSTKSSRSSNNEVELSEGHESEVLWFEEELPAVSLQTQREAEELRLKQLQIEQEIEQIKQLEAQESIPYYYLREIPNKPPPPYTPPGQSVQAKELRPVPTRREDVEQLVTLSTNELATIWRRKGDLSSAEPTEEYRSTKIGNQVYNKFLFDLVKQIFINVTSNGSDEKALPPWERTGCQKKCLVLPELTEESISNFVMKKVRVLFGFEPDSIKENLIIQWSRKKRDRVDELLVRESQEEERDWTDYSECEVAVKNNVALSIFDSLLEETGLALSAALQKKLSYHQQLT